MSRRDAAYMPDTYAAEIETLPLASHAILWLTVAFLVIALIWANLAMLDEVAHADGRVIPSSQVQVIQNLEGGILAEILVAEGERVDAGQPLLRIDDTRFASSFNEGQLAEATTQARIARLTAEIEGIPFVPPQGLGDNAGTYRDQLQLYNNRQQELSSSLSVLEQQLRQNEQALAELRREEQKLTTNADLAKEELAMTEPLVATGAVSRVELLRLQVSVNESMGQLEVTRLAIPKAESVVQEAENRIAERKQQFTTAAQNELTEARAELSRIEVTNVALEDRVNRTSLRSPVDGTVKQVLVTTEGAVVQPGADLVEIVPLNDTLLIEAKIRPADVAFIHPGQRATVKLTAYDYAIYGGLDAVLELISADSITDESGEHFFQIQVRTKQNNLGSDANPLPIIPGMVATVDIITGEKTVMDYLLKPLKRAQALALTEK